jgi:hypothetical protein
LSSLRRTWTVVGVTIAVAALPLPKISVPTTEALPPLTRDFPTRHSAGLPPSWQPERTVDGDYTVTTAGAVVEDVRIVGSLLIQAENVTARRVEVVGGGILNQDGDTCYNGLVIESTSIVQGDPEYDQTAIATGGYTARNVLIDGLIEGFRVGGAERGCGPVVIEDSYARIVQPRDCTPGTWHGDALQGYRGDRVTIRNSVLEVVGDFDEGCGGTAAFFYPDQGNQTATVDGLIAIGGGIPFRLGTPGTVNDLHVIDGEWGWGPTSVDDCAGLRLWDAYISVLDKFGQPRPRETLPCY